MKWLEFMAQQLVCQLNNENNKTTQFKCLYVFSYEDISMVNKHTERYYH